MNVGTLYANLVLATGEFDKGLSGAGARLRSFGAQISQAGRDMMVLTAPLAAAGGAATQTGMQFETAFAKIEGLVGITGSDLEMLKARALELAGTTAKAPVELANALYYLTSSGMSAAESAEVLEVAAKGSAVGLGTTQDVAKAAAFAVNAYRDSGLSAAEATDILTSAVKFGTIEADEMAPVLGRLLPIASSLHISYNQVAGTLAVMSRTGLDAAEAATSMSSIFSNLVKPSVAARKVLASVGLSMAELREVASREPDGVIQVYRLLSKTLNDEQFSVVVPNVRALRGAMNFLSQDAGLVDEVMQGVADSTGSLNNAMRITSQTAEFQLNQTISDLQVSSLKLWEGIRGPFIQALKDLSKVVKDAAAWFSHLDSGTKETIVKIGVLLVALGPLLIVMGSLVKVTGGLVSGFGSLFGATGKVASVLPRIIGMFSTLGKVSLAVGDALVGAIPKLTSPLSMLKSGVGGASSAMSGFMGSLTAMINPLALIGVALVAVVLQIIDFATAAERGRKAADEMVHSVAESKGGFHTFAEAAAGAQEAMDKLVQKQNEAKGQWLDIALDIVPFIGAMRQATRAEELHAGVAEVAAAALRELQATLDAERLERQAKAAETFTESLLGVADTMRELGPDFKLTESDIKILSERFGLSATYIQSAWESVQREFERQAAHIQDALESLPPDFEMTEEAAGQMATTIGVTADEVIAAWEAMKAAAEDGAVDMNHALGDISGEGEKAFSEFNESARYSMDDVRARIGVLQERLRQLDEEDLAKLGPSAAANWQDARKKTEQELGALTDFVDSNGKSIINTVEKVAEAVKLSADAMAGALSGLGTSSNTAWKAFKKAVEGGAEDVEARIDKLTTRLDTLNQVKLAELGPAALAAWMLAKTNTQTELGNLTTFVENKTEIIGTSLPDAIETSTTDAETAFNTAVGLVQDKTGEMTDTAESEGDDTAAALPDALNDHADALQTEMDNYYKTVSDTSGDITDNAETEGEDTASALPDAFNDAKPDYHSTLQMIKNIVDSELGKVEGMAGRYGSSTADAWLTDFATAIRSGRGDIHDALRYATRGMVAFSPPRFGPLRDIAKWAASTAKAWVMPFQDVVRNARLLDSIEPTMMMGRLNSAAMPALVPAIQQRYDLDRERYRGSDGDGGVTINGGIHIGRVEVPEGTTSPSGFARAVVTSMNTEIRRQSSRISEATRK